MDDKTKRTEEFEAVRIRNFGWNLGDAPMSLTAPASQGNRGHMGLISVRSDLGLHCYPPVWGC
ncbi:hypothetical protein COLO4_33673 [Corchorus olitorius]|uniref:Uncharacterized protein n=1 Tax=Corchorus olitorius TaxID=93759 RepID=A0A1R3GSB8_9ROSI|nr:hypothetical protein COLO4_33673 [Corchorus olitorius]